MTLAFHIEGKGNIMFPMVHYVANHVKKGWIVFKLKYGTPNLKTKTFLLIYTKSVKLDNNNNTYG